MSINDVRTIQRNEVHTCKYALTSIFHFDSPLTQSELIALLGMAVEVFLIPGFGDGVAQTFDIRIESTHYPKAFSCRLDDVIGWGYLQEYFHEFALFH